MIREFILIRSYSNFHLTECIAKEVMKHLHYTDDTDTEYDTPFWSVEETSNATAGWDFPEGTTEWDIWVALNFFYADTCKVLNAQQALKAGYQFYFQDEDAPDNKLYRYLKAMGTL